MRVSDLRCQTSPRDPAAWRVSARVDRLGAPPGRLWFDLSGCAREAAASQWREGLAEVFLAAVLPQAAADAATHGDAALVIEAPVSAILAERAERVSAAWARLRPGMAPVALRPTGLHLLPPVTEPPPLLALGLDLAGLYSFGRRREDGGPQDDLLAVLPEAPPHVHRPRAGRLAAFARRHDRRLHLVVSNLTALHPVHAGQEGAALTRGALVAAAGHLLGRRAARLVVPTPLEAFAPGPRAQLAALEPLLGSERLRLVPHGGGLSPADRLRWLVEETELAGWLHVCTRHPLVNCGRCAACRSTMLALDALDQVEGPAFDWSGWRRDGETDWDGEAVDATALRGVMSLAADRGRGDLVALGRRWLHDQGGRPPAAPRGPGAWLPFLGRRRPATGPGRGARRDH